MLSGQEVPREMLDEQTLKNDVPIGTGLFMLKTIQLSSSEEDVRNPGYFVGGRPYLDGKKFTLVPDPSAREAAFRAGQIDLIVFTDVHEAQSVAGDLGDRMQQITFPSTNGVSFVMNIKRNPFTDPKGREAAYRAIDVSRLINVVWFGDAERCSYFSAASSARFPLGYDAVKQYASFDKTKATQLIEASGYDGRTLAFVIPSDAQAQADAARLIAEDLRNVGIKVELQPEARNIFLKRVSPKPGDFDIALAGLQDYELALSNTSNFFKNGSLDDPEIDALINKIITTVDADKRKSLSQQFELLSFQRYSPLYPMLILNAHVGWSSKVKGQDFEASKSGVTGWQPNI